MKHASNSPVGQHNARPLPAAADRLGRCHTALAPAPSVRGAGQTARRLAGVAGPQASPHRYRSVLVPVDGSPFGEHALPLALGVARRAGATVRVAYVHRPFPPAGQPSLYPDAAGLNASLRSRGRVYLDDLTRRLAKAGAAPVLPVFLEGDDVAEALREEAACATDLVVMATHARGPLGRLWWGSVADALVRGLSAPVMLVRGYDAPADLTGDPTLRGVVIPLDGTSFAERILDPALALGALQGADHTLLRVVRPPPVGEAGGPQDEEWGYLRGVADRLAGRGARARPCLVQDDGPAAEAILRHARTHDADLIALATNGRRGLGRLFRGSVADRVVRGTSGPVLLLGPEPDG